MAAAAVASASARQTLTPDEKRALFLAACDTLLRVTDHGATRGGVSASQRHEERRKKASSIYYSGNWRPTIIAGYNQQYSSKGELEGPGSSTVKIASPRPTRQPSHATSMPRTEPADG